MSYDLEPAVGSWYHRIDDEQTFKVVGVDEENDIIELQYADGEVEEISGDAWRELDLEVGTEPEGWARTSADEDDDDYEELEEDDDGDDDSDDDYDDRGD